MLSSSSKKIVEGWQCLAKSKSTLISFQDQPLHLLTMLLAEILKKVVLHQVATAFASIVLPVPGGPNKSTPRQGQRIPLNKQGYLRGSITAYLSSRLASSRPTMSSNLTFGFSIQISRWSELARSLSSGTLEQSGMPFVTLTSCQSYSAQFFFPTAFPAIYKECSSYFFSSFFSYFLDLGFMGMGNSVEPSRFLVLRGS